MMRDFNECMLEATQPEIDKPIREMLKDLSSAIDLLAEILQCVDYSSTDEQSFNREWAECRNHFKEVLAAYSTDEGKD